MQQVVDLFLKIWLTLSQAGLSPLDIALVIVSGILFAKTNQLDADLHACLEKENHPTSDSRGP